MGYLEFGLYFYPLNTTSILQTTNFNFSLLQLPPTITFEGKYYFFPEVPMIKIAQFPINRINFQENEQFLLWANSKQNYFFLQMCLTKLCNQKNGWQGSFVFSGLSPRPTPGARGDTVLCPTQSASLQKYRSSVHTGGLVISPHRILPRGFINMQFKLFTLSKINSLNSHKYKAFC